MSELDNIICRVEKRLDSALELEKAEKYLIDRQGKVHKYKGKVSVPSFHNAIARRLFPDAMLADDYVNRLGWVTVGNGKWKVPVCYRELSQAQISTLSRKGLLSEVKIIG